MMFKKENVISGVYRTILHLHCSLCKLLLFKNIRSFSSFEVNSNLFTIYLSFSGVAIAFTCVIIFLVIFGGLFLHWWKKLR